MILAPVWEEFGMSKGSAVKVLVGMVFIIPIILVDAANAANPYKTGVSCGKRGCKEITRMNKPVAGKNCVKTTAGFHKTGQGAVGRSSIKYSGHYLCN
jgi:hypothetical protein